MHGGRTVALQLLSTIPKDYAKYRNDVNRQNTNLSAHNKFGTVSIREFYHACKEEALIRQLYWRDFYYHICVLNEGFEAFQAKYRGLSWQNDEQWFELWKEGSTGVPIVDAAMRCLKQTGVMHNRLRMVVASFLTKDLLIDWKWGEKHFAHYLVDYDPAQNNGGWVITRAIVAMGVLDRHRPPALLPRVQPLPPGKGLRQGLPFHQKVGARAQEGPRQEHPRVGEGLREIRGGL